MKLVLGRGAAPVQGKESCQSAGASATTRCRAGAVVVVVVVVVALVFRSSQARTHTLKHLVPGRSDVPFAYLEQQGRADHRINAQYVGDAG